MFGEFFANFLKAPGGSVERDAVTRIAFNPALRRHEKICPHCLWTHIAAPNSTCDSIHEEKHQCGKDQQAGGVIEFLRPDLDEEKIKTPMREINEHGLRWRVWSTIPAHEGEKIINR